MYHAQHGSPQELRRQFSADRLETASSARILVLCFDRLDRDLALARTAIQRGDHFAANEELTHAQDLVGELAAMLDLEVWEHAGSLLAIYDYLLRLLLRANSFKSEALVAEAQRLISEIGEAFRAAAATAGREQGTSTFPRGIEPADGTLTQFSVQA
jgi:flagellar protein FliS